MLKYQSIQEIVDEAAGQGRKISEIVLEDQAAATDRPADEIRKEMEERFAIMCESVRIGMDRDLRSNSGLTGGEGYRMMQYAATAQESSAGMKAGSSQEQQQGPLCGSFLAGAMARALAVAGCNASMGKIVAAPTAGSCGILPGCLVSLLEERNMDRQDLVMALFTAGAFGMVIANNASVAGAEGGCQAECGSAAAMAAAALVEVMGGSPAQSADACAIAISSQLGLVCDPVAGLVEIPCIKRNAAGVMTAFSSADMALAGIPAMIPADECIEAMRQVGDALPSSLKETAAGGLAVTKTGQALRRRVFGDN